MPWNEQGDGGGGPWGGGKGPWGGKPGPETGAGKPNRDKDRKNPFGGGDRKPPDLDALLQGLLLRFRGAMPNGGGSSGRHVSPWLLVGIGALIVLLLWLSTGIYRVQPDEQGVVLRFGAYRETTQSGLHYHLPQPIELVLKPTVTRVRRTDIGFGVDGDGTQGEVPSEALMLTGDENIVDINLSVFWTVKDARAYLFNIRNADATVKSAAESAIREVVGQSPISPILAEGRGRIESDTQKLLQSILDTYGAGILVTEIQLQKADPPQPVIEAFRDVQRARTDMDRLRNEAEAYRNDVLPRARGDAQRLTQGAEGFRQEVIARSQGDAQRFNQVYHAWSLAKDVTTQRLYLETMEDVLKSARKIIVEKNTAGTGVLPYLPLSELQTPQSGRSSSSQNPSGSSEASSNPVIVGSASDSSNADISSREAEKQSSLSAADPGSAATGGEQTKEGTP